MSEKKVNIIDQRSCLSSEEVKAYITKSLSPNERFDVENHLLECEFCQSAMDGYIQFPQEIHQATPPNKNYNWIYAAAAGLLLLLGVRAAIFSYQNTNQPAELFANFYDKPTWDIQTRGEQQKGQYAESIQLYNQGHFSAALVVFDTLLIENPEDNRLRLYKGIAHLEEDQFTDAESQLSTVRINSDIYFEEASWYLALLQVKIGKNNKAINYLNELIEPKQGFFYERALELKKGLQD